MALTASSTQQQLQYDIRRHKEAMAPICGRINAAEEEVEENAESFKLATESRDAHFNAQTKGEQCLGALHRGMEELVSLREIEKPDVDLGVSECTLLKRFKSTIKLLRERRERDLLVQVLSLLGDLHMSSGRLEDASQAYQDALDTFLSALDSLSRWREVLQSHEGCLMENWGASGVWRGLSIIGKLLIHCSRHSRSTQLELALLAAELSRLPFQGSLPHPQGHSNYSLYTPQLLGGPDLLHVCIFSNPQFLSAPALCAALRCAAETLMAGGRYLPALPMLAILEHCSTFVASSLTLVAASRLQRVECLCRCGFIAAATSLLASVLVGGEMPCSAVTSGLQISHLTLAGSPTSTGLPFYGFEPFFDHLPASHPENMPAVQWIMGDATKSQGDAASASSAQLHQGGRATDVDNAIQTMHWGLSYLSSDLAKKYGRETLCQLSIARAQILLALGRCDCSPGHESDIILTIRQRADELLAEVQTALMHSSPSSCNVDGEDGSFNIMGSKGAFFMAKALLLRATQAFESGKFRVCRHHSSRGIAVLQSICSGNDTDDNEAGCNTLHVWLECRSLLARCALAHGRIIDAFDLCRRGQEEASIVRDGRMQRRFHRLRLQGMVARGDLTDALHGAISLRRDHESFHARDEDYIAVLQLISALSRAISLRPPGEYAGVQIRSAPHSAEDLLQQAGAVLWQADKALRISLKESGWIGFGRLSYCDIRTNDMGYDAQPRLFAALKGGPGAFMPTRPVDVNDITASSCLANLYYPQARELLAIRAQLILLLVEFGGKLDESVFPDKSSPNCLALAEELLELMRHIAHPSAEIRASVLLAIGYLRKVHLPDSPELAIAAIEGALSVSWGRAGHDRDFMREACTALAQVHHDSKEQHATIHYMRLAAELASMQRTAIGELSQSPGAYMPLPMEAIYALPRGVVDELVGPHVRTKGDDGQTLNCASLLRYGSICTKCQVLLLLSCLSL
jgi:hypothetical protein